MRTRSSKPRLSVCRALSEKSVSLRPSIIERFGESGVEHHKTKFVMCSVSQKTSAKYVELRRAKLRTAFIATLIQSFFTLDRLIFLVEDGGQ
jgi:hypothetical protein